MSRRSFAQGCSASIAALAGGRLGLMSFARKQDSAARDTLVVISLRGGCDGLNLLAPVDDHDYAAARPASLRVRDSGAEAGLRLDSPIAGGDFRLHPAAGGLKELYDSGALAVVHACGLKHATRSHFEAMEIMERGGERRAASGWLARHLDAIGAEGLLPAIAAGSATPLALAGSGAAISMPSPAEFGVAQHWKYGEQQLRVLRGAYQGDSRLLGAGARTLQAISTVAEHIPRDGDGSPLAYAPDDGAEYPGDWYAAEISGALQSVAALIKMDVGLQVATVDYGGWDTHEGQAGSFAQLVDGLSRALLAFYNDVARYHDRLTVVVLSEFGRRLRANASGGTDHGHGNLMLALGGGIRGGRMYGSWPGLATEQLDDGADLAITTDYRAVLAEILAGRVGNPRADLVFPGLPAAPALGIVR